MKKLGKIESYSKLPKLKTVVCVRMYAHTYTHTYTQTCAHTHKSTKQNIQSSSQWEGDDGQTGFQEPGRLAVPMC